MGLFDKIFGSKKDDGSSKTPPPQPKQPPNGGGNAGGGAGGGGGVAQSMENLDNTIELLEKREQVLEKKIEAEVARAKEFLGKNNKAMAMQCMKRKKMYEDQILKLQAQKDNMETMRFTLQEQAMNREVLEAQRRAGQQLNQLNAGMNADRVEDDMDDIRDAMDQANDVTNALTQSLDQNVVDEDDLMAELDELAGATTTTTTTTATTQQVKPANTVPSELAGLSVPGGNMPEPKQQETDEEAALAALEAELNA